MSLKFGLGVIQVIENSRIR